jgi:hypothetical protein
VHEFVHLTDYGFTDPFSRLAIGNRAEDGNVAPATRTLLTDRYFQSAILGSVKLEPVKLTFPGQITERVQNRYNLSVPRVFLRAFWLPTVPQNHIVIKVVLALQAEGHPFEPDTAHQ